MAQSMSLINALSNSCSIDCPDIASIRIAGTTASEGKMKGNFASFIIFQADKVLKLSVVHLDDQPLRWDVLRALAKKRLGLAGPG